jgi:predicted RNA-binding Zn-ribbon protein involved in translation (DUF1610 family)
MSTFKRESLTCFSCEHEFIVPILKGIHITRMKHVRDLVKDYEFQQFACPECSIVNIMVQRELVR